MPHVLLTAAEVEAAVDDLIREDMVVVDIETTRAPCPRLNELLWVGLGAAGRNYLIPCGHPKGIQTQAEHRERTPAALLYPNDQRGLTKLGKPSMRQIEHTVAATFAPPPKQLFPHEVTDLIQPLLFSDVAKLGHSVKFDLQSLAKYYGNVIPPGPYHDTILIRHALTEDLDNYGLKELIYEWYHIPWKQRQAFYPNLGSKGIENFGLDQAARYLARDLRSAWLMFHSFHPMLTRRGVKDVYDFEMSVYPVIMDMEYEGFPVDPSKMDLVREEIARRQLEVQTEAWQLAGDQFSLNHTESKRWIMFGEGKPLFGDSKRMLKTYHLKVLLRTKETSRPAITAAVLEHWRDRGNRMAELLLDWSLLEKLRGTFIEGLTSRLRYTAMGTDPTVHTSFKQHGTVTGRLSAAEPNLQQLPRGTVIRDLFVAGDGYDLIVADYDQIELRCAGYSSQDAEMLRVFIEGQDIHALAASVMLGIPLEQVTEGQRQVGKTQNFGTLYGAGAERIAAVARVSVKRAEAFIRNYFDTFAGLEDWKRLELKLARERGDRADPLFKPPFVLIPPNGRRRRLPDLFHVDDWKVWRAERQAINAYVQGFASNIAKQAMLDLHVALKPYPAKMIAQVHDEIVVRVAKEASQEVLELVGTVMGNVRNPQGAPILGEIPLVASTAIGPSWAAAKKKK